MRWSQTELDNETPERRALLGTLISAERIAAMPARLQAWGQMSSADQMRLDLVLFPPGSSDE
jgi:hypothetical protein